ncbi:aldo/keto reductase [Brachybacterium kimchii]|uniref:Aldo/keto reductase n=2 Tax=Brachybacterium kimchii TaxID=2942909 RepID=A0ABY4N4J9_9MICO|nr:aldo/keto reductase [Brachybacterium kimchii]UQN28781.1 aldo/keto reductase [Brachybacterium kimchii]
MPAVLGYEVPSDRAVDLVERVLTSPVGVIDTSNGYNDGESERRIGRALANIGPASGTLVVTKVDAERRDYSGDRVRASVRESQERLGMDHLPLVHLHDPEFHDFDDLSGPGGAVRTLLQLKEEGVIGAIGVAGGHAPTISRYVELGVFDALLVHNRLTLVDRSAERLFERAASRGMAVFNAGIYGGGILASPEAGRSTYAYRPASPAVLEAIASMHAACIRHGIPLATAALQASLREPTVDCTLVGMSRPERLEATLRAASEPIPESLWHELDELRPSPELWIDAQG